jgi:hypothetical protein
MAEVPRAMIGAFIEANCLSVTGAAIQGCGKLHSTSWVDFSETRRT